MKRIYQSDNHIKIEMDKLSIGVLVLSVVLIMVSAWLITATFLIIGSTR